MDSIACQRDRRRGTRQERRVSIQPVYRYPLMMPINYASLSEPDISKPLPQLEVIFRVRLVERKGCRFFCYVCESCLWAANPREETISSPDFALSAEDLPEGVWEWMHRHAEMHICIGQWYRRIDRR
jgi:hypothetical protein